jgi:chromate reductase
MVKLLGISGSLRAGSYNSMLVREAARVFAPDEFTFASLHLPLYDGDLEAEGMPAEVLTLCAQITAADAIVISTPEYNKNPSGVLKNALDWVSRVHPVPLVGKPVAVVSAAAGLAGGQRATAGLWLMLIPFKIRLVHEVEVGVGGASNQFGTDGRLTNEKLAGALASQMRALREVAEAEGT